jgi:hypothetical protein
LDKFPTKILDKFPTKKRQIWINVCIMENNLA